MAQHYGGVGRGADTIAPPRRTRKKTPRPAPTPTFTQPVGGQPLARQQQQAAAKTQRAQNRSPAPVVAAPPVIHNPTPTQTRAAAQQISSSITRIVGSTGSAQERQQRRDAIVARVQSDPRLAPVAASWNHWSAEQAKITRPQVDRVKAGPAPTHARIGFGPVTASVNLTATSRALGALAAKATPGLHSGATGAQIARNAFNDIGALAKGPFIGTAALGAATVADAQHGQRPFAQGTQTAGIVQQVGRQTGHEIAHPVESFKAHPLLTALDVAGAASVVGRTAGAFARTAGSTTEAAGVRGALARGGSTVRPPIALTNDVAGGYISRTYSKDLTRKAAQVAQDKAHLEPLTDEAGNPVTVTDRGRKVQVMTPATELGRKHLANRRADILAGRANSVERIVRENAGSARTISTPAGAAVRNALGDRLPAYEGEPVHGISGRATRDIVAMAVEATITSAKHMAQELRDHVKHLDDEYNARIDTKGFRHSDEAKTNRARAKLARKVLDSPKAMSQAKAIVAEAERHGRALNAADVEKANLGIEEAPRLKRAALETPALEHMGARHFTVDEHRALEADAGKAETAAREKLDAAKTPTERKAAQAELDTAREHRIEVSGRDPERVKAHEDAQATHATARTDARKAHEAERKAQARVSNLAAAHRSARGREAHHGPVAAYTVDGQRFTLLQDAVKHAKAKGIPIRDIKRVAITPGESKRVGELSNARRALATAKARRRAADETVRKAKRAADQNPLPDIHAAIRYGENSKARGFDKPAGAQLPNEDIEAFLHSRGRDPGTVAYLPHRGDIVGKRAYHKQVRYGTRPTEKAEARTGSAYTKGATESSAKLLRDQGVRQQVQIANAKAIDRAIGEHGVRHPAWTKAQRGEKLNGYEQRVVDNGGYFTAKEATETADRLMHDKDEYLIPVRAHAAKLSEETRRVIREDLQGPGGMDSLGQRMLNDRVVTDGDPDGSRNVVLMSGHLFDRQLAHLNPPGAFQKFAQVINRAFRYAVLPQPRWLTGNFVEPYGIRLTLKGSGLNVFGLGLDITKSRQLFKKMKASGDPRVRAAAAEMEAHGLGGLLLGQRGLTQRRALEDFPTIDGTVQRAYGKIVSKLPAVETFGDITGMLLKGGAKAVLAPLKAFFLVNRAIERGAQHAALGGFARDELQAFTGSWIQTLKTSQKAWDEASKGYVNTATQHRLVDEANRILGKYADFSPTLRAIVQGPAPFLPWALNTARFVLWTMPAQHTAVTALLTKIDQVVEKDWQQLHSNVPPGDLKLAIPNGDGGWLDIARYTPYGLTGPIAEGDPEALTSQFYPQISGAQEALQGKNAFGQDLQFSGSTAPPTTGQLLKVALNSALESSVPYLSTARRLQEHGQTAYADSTVLHPRSKPGTSYGRSAATRVFDPLSPTYLGAPTGDEKVSTPSQASAPPSRRDALLARRAQVMAGRGAANARLQALLERRAALLAARGG